MRRWWLPPGVRSAKMCVLCAEVTRRLRAGFEGGDDMRTTPTMVIDGARLRAVRADDAPAIYEYLSDPRVTELTSYPAVTIAMVESMVARWQRRWSEGELSKWGIAVDPGDRVVGVCGFNDWSDTHRWAEVAFELAPSHWGSGLARKALTAVLEWTFRRDQVDRVHAYVRVDNARSFGLLERCGFSREGRLRSFRVCRGQAHDFFVYSLLRSEWKEAP